MEDKKKTTKKKTTTTKSKDQYKKGKAGVAARKETAKKTETKKTTVKKAATKKTTVKKTPAKKVEEEVVIKKVAPKKETKVEKEPKKIVKKVEIEEETELEDIDFLEKTLIFDGKEKDNLRSVVEKLESDTIFTKDKIIKRKKSHRIAIIILTILIFVTLVVSATYVVTTIVEEKRNTETVNSNIYEKVLKNYDGENVTINTEETTTEEETEDDYAHINDITLKEFENNILNKTNMTVLIASKTCIGCINLQEDLEPALAEADKTIYRLSISDMTDTEVSRLRTYYYFSSTPTIFVVKDGVVTKDNSEVSNDKEELINWIITNIE